jgi:hypothetical protein
MFYDIIIVLVVGLAGFRVFWFRRCPWRDFLNERNPLDLSKQGL